MKPAINAIFPLLLTLSSMLWAADECRVDTLELAYSDGMQVYDKSDDCVRVAFERIDIDHILPKISNLNARKIYIFIRRAVSGETDILINALSGHFKDYSRFCSGSGSDGALIELISHDRQNSARYCSSRSSRSIETERLIAEIGPEKFYRARRIVWFYKYMTKGKLHKLVESIRRQYPEHQFKITTWLIGKRRGLIEIDGSA